MVVTLVKNLNVVQSWELDVSQLWLPNLASSSGWFWTHCNVGSRDVNEGNPGHHSFIPSFPEGPHVLGVEDASGNLRALPPCTSHKSEHKQYTTKMYCWECGVLRRKINRGLCYIFALDVSATYRTRLKCSGPFSSCIDLGHTKRVADRCHGHGTSCNTQDRRRDDGLKTDTLPAVWTVPADIHVGEKPAYKFMGLEPNLVL